ncbi:MAG: hypothetical protein M1335_00770 [Chloroflexi bacterium]|nr:hypothetical protein [Chloroflexota bacterium]
MERPAHQEGPGPVEERKPRRSDGLHGHVKTIYVLDWIMAVLFFLGIFGTLVPLLIVPPYPISPGRIGGGVAGVAVTGTFFVLSVVAIVATLSGRRWGWYYHIVYSILNLLVIPVGTVVQGFALYYLFADPAVKAWFRGQRPEAPPEKKAA